MLQFDEIMLMSNFSCTKQRDIAQELFDSYNISNPEAVKAALSDAAWRGFCAGLEACKQLHGKKE